MQKLKLKIECHRCQSGWIWDKSIRKKGHYTMLVGSDTILETIYG